MPDIEIFADKAALYDAATEKCVSIVNEALSVRGVCSIALSGGSTPRPLYQRLADAGLDWSRVHLFWSDERCVPPNHPESNFRMARGALIDHINIPDANIHRMEGELEPQAAAERYAAELRAFFGESPRFDLTLLGLGEDGHTASLFPRSSALRFRDRWVAANYVEKLGAWRITLTVEAINSSRYVMMLVAGGGKAAVVEKILRGAYHAGDLPAKMIAPRDGDYLWLLDSDAGSML